MSLPLRLLVDQDGVLADWGPEYNRQLNMAGSIAANIPRHEERTNWHLHEGRTEVEKRIIRGIMAKPGFYANLEPIPGAKEVLKDLVKQGVDVRIVSSPFISNPTCASDKMNWIVKHYGSHWGSRLILTTDKTTVRGDVLIDDKPEITALDGTPGAPEWRHVLFGDYAYNRHVTDRPRLLRWTARDLSFAVWEALAVAA